jgi:transglutaminase-like putative cysteine protease
MKRKPATYASLAMDHLRWLLLGLLLALVPLFGHLHLWIPLVAVAIGVWRYQLARRQLLLPRLRLLVPLVLAGAAGVLASHPGGFGRDASVALLVLMMAMKLLEANSRRDAVLLIYLAWFLSLTTFLFSQSLLLGLYMLLPVTLLTAILLGLSHPGGTLPITRKLGLASTLLLQAVPLMLALFLLFPRFSGPLWGLPKDSLQGMTGLSEDMAPGSISQLSISDEVAFRAEFFGPVPDPQQRYWRGPVFWHFDSRSWRPGSQSRTLPPAQLTQPSARIDYAITLEAHNRSWLFMLDVPATLPPQARLRPDYQVLSHEPVRSRLRYTVASYLNYQLDADLDPQARQLALQLPAAGNPRARALGHEWATSGDNHLTIVKRAMHMFREQEFIYTLIPPLLGHNSIDDFLFVTRRGFCEHYAGSFVFLMRAAGVPARVVTGYQGGEVNPIGGYLIVRQSDAHAWAEVWLPGQGWTRVDPTSAVSPQRIEAGIANALPAGEALPALVGGEYPLLRRAYLGLDALNNSWNQWVLGYNQQRQLQLLAWLYGSGIGMQQVALTMITVLGLLLLGFTLAFLRASRQAGNKLDRAFRRFTDKLARAGMKRQPWEGPLDFAQRAALLSPRRAEAIRAIAADYAAQRYGHDYTPQRCRALIYNIRKFRP